MMHVTQGERKSSSHAGGKMNFPARGIVMLLTMAIAWSFCNGKVDAQVSDIAWRTGALFPYEASRLTGTSLDHFGYGIGGDNNGSCGDFGSGGTGFYRYNPATDQWQALEPPPFCTTSADNFCALGGSLFKPGGFMPSVMAPIANLLVYDVSSMQWNELTALPEARWNHAAVALLVGSEPRVLCFGGRNQTGEVSDVVYSYSVSDDRWETVPAMPGGAREALSATVAHDELGREKIFVVGGKDASGAVLDRVEEYDPATGSWRTRSPLPQPRYYHTCETTIDSDHPGSDLVYAIGGEDETAIYTTVFIYVTATDAWLSNSNYDCSYRRRSHGSFVIDDDLYTFAGWYGDYLQITEIGDTFIVTPTPSPTPSPTPPPTPPSIPTLGQPSILLVAAALGLIMALKFRH